MGAPPLPTDTKLVTRTRPGRAQQGRVRHRGLLGGHPTALKCLIQAGCPPSRQTTYRLIRRTTTFGRTTTGRRTTTFRSRRTRRPRLGRTTGGALMTAAEPDLGAKAN